VYFSPSPGRLALQFEFQSDSHIRLVWIVIGWQTQVLNSGSHLSKHMRNTLHASIRRHDVCNKYNWRHSCCRFASLEFHLLQNSCLYFASLSRITVLFKTSKECKLWTIQSFQFIDLCVLSRVIRVSNVLLTM